MNRLEGIILESLQDSWVIMYTFIAKELTEAGGFEGEAALREAVRRFGRDRGLTNQKRLLDNNIKINLETLFCEGRDRPSEPRFVLETIHASREQYVLCTHICSFADVWKKYNAKNLGRIYCEEFHIACYEAFGFGKTKVNLARSLTQDGDDRCIFSHTYHPENLSEEELRLSFEEYDEGYVRPDINMSKPQGKSGFNMLWIKMYFYLLECAVEQFGDLGRVFVGNGLRRAAIEQAKVFTEQAASTERCVDRTYVQQHLPLNLCTDEEPLWDTYDLYGAKQLLLKCFYQPFLGKVGI